ncbi:uncharacterized protein LOC112555334 [Pomacea canaliculata]|uniref:uncharacterized protein LOC112555334 n=1 Tax=Pomacea canaliculata TaxID=400727 RepID=UPI000D73D467|nr:uncharacterized protein LOC112555334 [Pomacea canaliculata]
MRDARVKKLICMSSWGAKDEPGLPRIITWFLKPTFLRNILANMAEMENFLQEKCSDINYTVVRPPGLNNNPLSGKEIITREGQFVDGASSLPRADLVKFMLSCLTSKTYDKKMIAVAIPK